MAYEAILYDMNGVIVDDEQLHEKAFREVLAAHGYELDKQGYMNFFAGKTDESGFQSYCREYHCSSSIKQLLDEKTKRYFANGVESLVPYPGIIETLRRGQKITRQAIVTGSTMAEVVLIIETFGIADCFELIVAADDISQSKPHPEGYVLAAQRLNVLPANCVVVEDSPSGVKAAKAAGMFCIAVATTHSPEDLKEADTVVSAIEPETLSSVLYG